MKFIALLRGINVSGKNKVPMAELRAHIAELGWADVQTYIQSGNVVFRAKGAAGVHESDLEALIARKFGLSIPVIVRRAADWPAYVGGNPFPVAAEQEPNRLMLCLSKAKPRLDAAETLREKARDGESLKLVGDALWIHYAAGAGATKLSPALLDRLVGSTVTGRNWRTVQKLQEMLAE
ncbi:MAG: DUF1697 domain-containing protein [Sphingosinicella sp.]|nr:DUF1697 domain-containing protein [Sphingosinicella sp.]